MLHKEGRGFLEHITTANKIPAVCDQQTAGIMQFSFTIC